MLEFRHLVVLHSVAEQGSMTKAAAELAFTPSAVSQQIAALERQTGTPLLIRHARGVRLTEAGRLLTEHTGALLQRLQRAETELTDLVNLRAGRLRLATFPSAGARLLPEAIGVFRREHPDVQMSLDIREPAACPALVRDGALDLAVVFDYHPGPTLPVGDLDRHRLLDDAMHVALPADHPAAAADPRHVAIAELREQPWIRDSGPDPMCREQLDHLCAAAGFRPHVAFESDDYLAVSRLVASGVGVALVPRLAADHMGPGVALREIRPRVLRRISAVTSPTTTPAVRAMLTVITDLSRHYAY
ncbi:DNA-binding transcriptional LysR family regulator [Spinactinospora alkalitolerans]|uniref:DNA-binding transcriptional LysR family regulator n=1 Tax=Spinactinospora alkalitolerans TaxID=687207 RepID=A0A852TSS4_9ACTN|nr:LysR family transcriptional regulator [Spinactinospora alkalitolerans]NYE47069.1 DNA-binding transcriptional LysR family regulator [Spinactinospora alkalitolerans]